MGRTRDTQQQAECRRFPVLSLFFCWRCPGAQEMLFYRILESGDVVLLQCSRGTPEKDWPYENYPDYFPANFESLFLQGREATFNGVYAVAF